jgi:hypothetical protein
MPPRIVRLLIALVMALTVPLQGLAATAAGVCMAMGHHEAGQAAAHAHAADHNHDSGASSPHGDSGQQNTHCAPCVSCCAAASISAVPQVFDPAAPATEAIPASPASLPGILPDQLDRPPLTG